MIELEKLNFEDKELLAKILEWRNDENTRKFSNNTNFITKDIFEKIIVKYKECKFEPLMIKFQNNYVGIITFVSNEDKIFIGINIDPNERGKHIGNLALKELIEKNLLFDTEIYAQIKKNNLPSIKLFQKFFNLKYEIEDYLLFSRKFNNLL